MTEALDAARQAVARYSWAEAFDHYTSAQAEAPLAPEDLEKMGESAWWVGKMRDCIKLRERAHAAYLEAGNTIDAARIAMQLSDHHTDLMEVGVASAWLNRAEKLIADEPEGAIHAHLRLVQAIGARTRGDFESIGRLTAEGAEIAARHGDKDLFALHTAFGGITLVMAGDVDKGMSLLQEATAGSVSGELGPYATGWIYCMMITACAHLADWQSAGEWTEAAKRWCDRQAINGFPGVCRIHRAEIMRLRGSLSEAEEEARTATIELGSFNLHFAALAFRELGDVRLRLGDIEGAEEAFRQANEMGVSPQPGLALVQALRGKPQAAASSLKRALADQGLGPMDRASLLPTYLEVSLEVGDTESARSAASELAGLAESYTSPARKAVAEQATAAVALADGDIETAEPAAIRARRLYKETDLTYEAARVSLLIGQIYQAEGDTDGAQFEISSALSTFDRIGAIPDAERARKLLASLTEAGAPKGRRVAKTFLFSDIVGSTNLVEAIGDDAWTDLLKWHDDTLRKLFAAHGGEEVVHTGDGFFIAFETADDAFACATAIQQTLAEHRRAHGFSPQVRIGLHSTEAAELKGNYHGKGVHEAARIGALAEGGEVLTSVSTLENLSEPVDVSEERTVTLKGVAAPVRIASVVWRVG